MSRLRRCAAVAGLAVVASLGPAGAQTVEPQRPGLLAGASIKIDTVTVRDLTFDTPGQGRWSIGRVIFSGLVRDNDRVRADRIRIESIALASGPRTIEVPAIVISGADLPAPLVPILTAGGQAGDLATLLASATIDRITIERVIQRDAPAQVEITYSDVVLRDLKSGHVATARIAEASATMPGGPGMAERVQLRMGEIRYQQFDVAEMVRMITGGGGGAAKRILQRAIVDGIEVTTDKATVRIKRIELADIDGRAPAQALPAGLQAGTPAHLLDPEQQKQAAAYASDMIRYLRIGRYSIEGISVTAPGQGTFALGAIAIAGFSKRGIDRIELTGFNFQSPGPKAKLDRFAIEGLNYEAALEAGLEAARSGGQFTPSPAQMAQIVPRVSAIRLAGLDLDTPQGPMSLKDFAFEFNEGSDGTRLSYALHDLKVDLRRLDANDGRDKLMALGYQEMTGGAQARVNWQRKDKTLTVETVGVSLEQVGRIELIARLDNVDIDRAAAEPMAAQAVLSAARLGPIELRVADLGLAARFYADTAKSAGVSPDAIRAGLAAEMRAQASAFLGPMLAAGSADAIARFLQSPGTIRARIAPAAGQAPLTVGEIQTLAPPDLMQRLSLMLQTAPR